eukprot:9192684-Alexandrium_andersonii.AAC.1
MLTLMTPTDNTDHMKPTNDNTKERDGRFERASHMQCAVRRLMCPSLPDMQAQCCVADGSERWD